MRRVKLLAWDCDGTLWDGTFIYGDEIKLKPMIKEIIQELDRRGILQTVITKNDEGVLDKLEELKIREYFLYPQASWRPKSIGLHTVKNILGFSRWDEIAMVDDDPFELAEVKHSFPEVRTISADQYMEIPNMEGFLRDEITEEDSLRRLSYLQEQSRKRAAEAYPGDYTSFLRTCEMHITMRRMTPADVPRVHQLLVRAHQYNTAVQVYSKEELQKMYDVVWVCEMGDKFGDYGLVGVKVERSEGHVWDVDLLVFSCRVAGKGLGTAFLQHTLTRAYQQNIEKVQVQFRLTQQNANMLNLLKFLEFEECGSKGDVKVYARKPAHLPYPDWLEVMEQ